MPILINTGAGGRTRTLNPQIRSLMLYPVELRPRLLIARMKLILKLNLDFTIWGERRDLNPRPLESQSSALPAELRPPS